MAGDIERIKRQEAELVFDRFDETVAFEIGSAIRERALAENLPIVIDIRLWDRALFYAALPGSTAINANWARRKINVVRMFLKSTYRMVLEQDRPDRTFKVGEGLDPADYVLAGGGFPIRVANAGVVGVIAVSGLPERQDHEVIVAALCAHLGLDAGALALSAAAAN
ncbi:heme-degrading domain-containing protein [Mesorhizobium sp. KR2-14]|uniref:heme-degrading domain-containing protein n=1 Tax=Mesorhizobium sp. KR2-14 TaxID=3156610 RepID=UPI0032B365B2